MISDQLASVAFDVVVKSSVFAQSHSERLTAEDFCAIKRFASKSTERSVQSEKALPVQSARRIVRTNYRRHDAPTSQTHLIRHESKKTGSVCLIQEMNLQLEVHLKSSPHLHRLSATILIRRDPCSVEKRRSGASLL
ncbi:hypothetical protein IRJ41_009648 [Triplophysa rosa]|uniref:Uncharacterized protein n=1 Tax=Triplophysa rosa TaxID=992332 RepID=A0A9W7TWI8_TRIRA|nr:hypothetical protein IRJ41_009648 [Triplophysa rosa]